MGVDDFFDDEFLDFDSDDDFEEFDNSSSFISSLNNFRDSLTTKHFIVFGGVIMSLFLVYFVSYRFEARNETNLTAETATVESNTSPTTTIESKISPTTTVESNISPTTTSSTTTTTTVTTNVVLTTDPLESTVMVALPDCGYMGSGTIISKLGFILTNEHVVSDDGTFCNDFIVILTSESGEKDPVPKYVAEIVEQNVTLDIAILEITGTYDGSPLPKSFRNMCVGDSNSVSQGDNLLIWGYPDVRWVNFDTPGRIDVSQGFVSGFDAETGLSEKAWISLSSTISSGNSGGGAYNELGQLVGVPTAVFQGNLSSRGLLRPMKLVLDYFDSFYFESCK